MSLRAARDAVWSTSTSPFGFPVMGIWRQGDDGGAVAAVDRWVRVFVWGEVWTRVSCVSVLQLLLSVQGLSSL